MTNIRQPNKSVGALFLERLGEESWIYIKTVVDIVHEPVLILDKDLSVMAANEPFYKMFQTEPKDTENKVIYELGNGQWNIPSLRKLLEDILPKKTFFKGFKVEHDFLDIGKKIMLLNALEVHLKEDSTFDLCPPIILLAIEDITEMMTIAKALVDHTNALEKEVQQVKGG